MGFRILSTAIWLCALVSNILPTPATDVSIEGAGFSLALNVLTKTLTGLKNPSSQIIAELGEMKEQLVVINGKLDKLMTAVENVMQSIEHHHDVTRIVVAFSEDVHRIKYFTSLFDSSMKYDDTNQVIVDSKAETWADAILSVSSDGMDPTLFDIDNMIKGSFGTEPVVEVYASGLILSKNPSTWTEVDRLVESLVQMQDVGYAYWGIALDITNRSDEKSTVQSMLEQRSEKQQKVLTVDERFKKWPTGQYGLVQAATGCPDGSWRTGSRFHDTENRRPGNAWSPSNIADYISGSFNKDDLEWRFCMSPLFPGSGLSWPRGRYCIFAGSSTCPAGFKRGALVFDDENRKNKNRRSGSVPSGTYDSNTRYEFCCRSDGSVNSAIRLPLSKPFVLFPTNGNSCQKVERMKFKELSLFWDCENGINHNKRYQSFPKETDREKNMRVHMCHYSFE